MHFSMKIVEFIEKTKHEKITLITLKPMVSLISQYWIIFITQSVVIILDVMIKKYM